MSKFDFTGTAEGIKWMKLRLIEILIVCCYTALAVFVVFGLLVEKGVIK